MRCCQGASASLLPASLRDLAFAFDSRNALALESEFHLHPHYRAKLPLEATLLKTEAGLRSEEHTSELQSRLHLVCRLLLEKKKKSIIISYSGLLNQTIAIIRVHSQRAHYTSVRLQLLVRGSDQLHV